MKSLKTLTFVGMATMWVASAHAYERCKSFENAELKAMNTERLEQAYCSNEDRLIEILEVVRLRDSEEAKRDRDRCWETLLRLSAQTRFDRDEKCPTAIQAGARTAPEEAKQSKRDLLRNLGIAGEKELSTR